MVSRNPANNVSSRAVYFATDGLSCKTIDKKIHNYCSFLLFPFLIQFSLTAMMDRCWWLLQLVVVDMLCLFAVFVSVGDSSHTCYPRGASQRSFSESSVLLKSIF